MDTPHMACLEQRIDELEQALYTIAGAVRYAHYSPLQALATVGRVATEALGHEAERSN